MNFNKVKNGKRVVVKKWDSTITVTEVATGKVLAENQFSDHVKAVALAKLLVKAY